MRAPRPSTVIVLVSVALLAALLAPAAAWAAFPGNNGRIAYTCGGGICTINPHGSDNRALAIGAEGSDPAWSPDGTKIAFTRGAGNASEIYVIRADGTLLTPLTVNQVADQDPAWSADGSKIVFSSNRTDQSPATCGSSCAFDLFVMNADGSQQARLMTGTTDLRQLDPSWEPGGTRIAYHCENQSVYRDVCLVGSDGTGRVQLGPGANPNWLPDGSRIAFDHQAPGETSIDVFTMKPDGGDRASVTPDTSGTHDTQPAWSPDGTKFAEAARAACLTPSSCPPFSAIVVRDADGSDPSGVTNQPQTDHQPDWQPLAPTPYPRPVSAPSISASLVPAFTPCSAPNRTHGPPLAAGSCHPPAPASQHLTAGTPTHFTGSVRLSVIVGDPASSVDDADVRFRLTLVDVKTVGGADYSGELQSTQTLRITDRTSGSATVEDLPFALAIPCSPTASDVGSTCALSTSADAVAPGAVREGVRSVWQVDQLRVFDGGGDGVAATEPNTLFAVQGVFVP